MAPQNISWELEENSRNFGASFSFESSSEIVEYQLILELFNEAEEKTYYLDVSIQAALVILPYLEYPTGQGLNWCLQMWILIVWFLEYYQNLDKHVRTTTRATRSLKETARTELQTTAYNNFSR